MNHFFYFVILILFFNSNIRLTAQSDLTYFLPSDVSYNQSIPTPEDYFGFQIGEWHLSSEQIDGYLKYLAKTSDRMIIEEYGRTYENKPLNYLTITSPENFSRIDEIKEMHAELSDPDESDEVDIDKVPVVIYMGYSVHGDEPSGSNGVPLLAYYLAAAQGKSIEEILGGSVILIAPCLNPDGFDRYAEWVNSRHKKNASIDPFDTEHRDRWPSSRTNHYWFDLNRDYLVLQQPETPGRIKLFHEWKPNLFTDHHEMGSNSTYFFQPGIPSRRHPLIPAANEELTAVISKYYAAALDELGSTYFTEERFDDFYFGKGSTYPDINGSIGILFEQAGSTGQKTETDNGTLTFPYTIRNHVATSLATLKAGLELRKTLLIHQKQFYKNAVKEASKDHIKAYIFGSSTDKALNYIFTKILLSHKIKVYELAKNYLISKNEFKGSESYIIPLAQPQFKLIQALFEKRTQFDDSLFYDISAWSLPLAFNMTYAEVSDDFDGSMIGNEITDPDFPEGKLTGNYESYAYLFNWEGYYSPRALYRLLKAGINVKVSSDSFQYNFGTETVTFSPGSIVIPLGIQKDKMEIKEISSEDCIDVYSVNTGLTSQGIDLGSPNLTRVELPKIMILIGDGVSSSNAGEYWHLFDQRYDMEISLVEIEYLNSVDLSNYTAILMVNGNYNEIDSNKIELIKSWVSRGGTLITIGGAVQWTVSNGVSSAQFRTRQPEIGDSVFSRRPYKIRSSDRGAQFISGAIFKAEFDLTHPISFGYSNPELNIFKTSTRFLEPSNEIYSTPLVYEKNPLVSGYISKENLELISGSASIVVNRLGGGRVILMVDDYNFRAFWLGTNKIIANAVFFGSLMN